jgi:hypothetical protein
MPEFRQLSSRTFEIAPALPGEPPEHADHDPRSRPLPELRCEGQGGETDARRVSIRIVQRGCGGFIDTENADTHGETRAEDQHSASPVTTQAIPAGCGGVHCFQKNSDTHRERPPFFHFPRPR